MPYLTLWDKISQNWAHLEGNSPKTFKSQRIFRPFYSRFYEEININHTMLRFSQASKVVPVLVLLFVALWFILRGDLLYIFPCVILFLCFLVLLVLQLPRLGKRELILVLFVRLFDLCLFRFVGFLFHLGSGKGCGLWLWPSLDFFLPFFFLHEKIKENKEKKSNNNNNNMNNKIQKKKKKKKKKRTNKL